MEVPESSRCNEKRYLKNTDGRTISLAPDWVWLPAAILFLILEKLLEPIDHVRLAAVCKDWCSVAKEYNQATRHWCNVVPMLLIPFYDTTGNICQTKRMLYSVSTGDIYKNVHLPVPYGRRCCGSSHGWLATFSEKFVITLLNPFRKARSIRLPPLDFIPFQYERMRNEVKKNYQYFVRKVILSTDPDKSPEDYVVVALYDILMHKLAFIKGGEKNWTYFTQTSGFYDAIFLSNSRFYAVRNWGEIYSFEVVNSVQPPKTGKLITLNGPFSSASNKAYLVESTNGDILHVRKFFIPEEGPHPKFWSESFSVYKLVMNDYNRIDQVELNSIGDEALFLGDNHSVSVLNSKFPMCQPNAIYYTNEYAHPLKSDMISIFKLEDKTSTEYYPINHEQRHIPSPIWIIPQFNELR